MAWYNAFGIAASLALHAAMLTGGVFIGTDSSLPSVAASPTTLSDASRVSVLTTVSIVDLSAIDAVFSDDVEPIMEPLEPLIPEALPVLQPAPPQDIKAPPPEKAVPPVQKGGIARSGTLKKAEKKTTISKTRAVRASPPMAFLGPTDTPPPSSSKVENGGVQFQLEASPDAPRNRPPEYPYAARRARQEGTVLLLVDVSSEGVTTSVKLHRSCGYSQLDEAARTAVQQWQFTPAKIGGITRASQVVVPIRFVLTRD